MSGRIAKAWEEYRTAVVPKEAGPEQLQGTEMAFVGGASAMFGLIVNSVGSGGGEPTAEEMGRMDALHEELLAHGKALAEGQLSVFSNDRPPDFYARQGAGLDVQIANWRPTPHGSGPPQQVHLLCHLDLGDGRTLAQAIRFKSPRGLDSFIADLQRHRKEVWP